MSGPRQIVYYLAPVLLVLIATLQIYRAHSLRQSPWAGGGFGMFAVIDGHPQRFVRLQLLTPRGEEPIEVPAGLEEQALAVRVVPSQRNLAEMGRRVLVTLSQERRESLGIRLEALSREFEPDPPRARIVRLGEVRISR